MSAEQPFNLESGLYGFNMFLQFPEDKREVVAAALETISQYHIPTDAELMYSRDDGPMATRVGRAYSDAADVFAKAIDPTFKASWERTLAEPNLPETEELRGLFYLMIRPYSSTQILDAAKKIKELSLASNQE